MSKAAVADDSFVPFGPASLAAARTNSPGGNLTVVPGPAADKSFTPFQGSSGNPAHAGGNGHGPASVTVQRDGDRITGIRLECACGQVTELRCEY
jgi:hypothetical protein